METESVVNMKIAAEVLKEKAVMEGGSIIDTERLMLDVLLTIDELVRESQGIKIEDVTQQEENGNLVVDLAIATEDSGDYESKHAAERLVLDILLSIDELVHESGGIRIQNIIQKEIRGKIAVAVQIVAEEIELVGEFYEDDITDVDMMPAPLIAGCAC